MMDLIAAFQLPFLQNALLGAVLVAVPTALLSCFLVLKGWSLMGDAVSHAVFPGVVLAWMAGLPLAVGAFTAGMACALATGFIKERSRVKQDTVMGVVFSGMFALGLVLYSQVQTELHLDHILFGDIQGLAAADLWQTGIIGLVVTLILLAKWREFLLHAFDPAQARAVGLRVGLLHYGLLALLSATIVGALSAAGVILAVALLIAPGATAFLLTRSFGAMMVVSVAVALVSSIGGVVLSVALDSAPAPTIVLLMTAAFAGAFAHATLKARRLGAA
ncbi:hypothetical protein GVY41_06185 [Frigidibacter albus]|uniref:Iron chelate uptake ABC transporter family permease subunit n=1 Tax=Frigidibacter albus TaxID=1465486 RepID=A0A6L8VE79_9RHOB|nr:metal ABC transporter permease [Frigidibacter albus]MZQ88595.1 hypothetical protein [Frigidibacter albus]NBE30596.1 hypothetical protein [Frigidibacter albus]GGH49360.1 membrane protein [Frigidibacter albus]